MKRVSLDPRNITMAVLGALLGCSGTNGAAPATSSTESGGNAGTATTATDSGGAKTTPQPYDGGNTQNHGGNAQNDGGTKRPPLTPDGPPYIGTGIVLTQPPYDWVGIIGTGQSLSVGAESVSISVTQPYKNLMLIDNGPAPKYPIDGSSSAQWSVVPLTEPHRPNIPGVTNNPLQYPNNICESSETPQSGMANAISKVWAERGNTSDYITAHSVVGVGGVDIRTLSKGTLSYNAALSEARVYKKLADASGKVFGVGGVILTHGETDTSMNTRDYGERVYQLWNDFNADLKAITNQPNNIVLLASQQSAVAGGYDSPAVQLWRAGRAHPGQVVCTGPKYAYGNYLLHMPGPSYQRLGEKYGEIFDRIVNRGVAWRPLGPNRIQRDGKVITVDFDVPNPPLVWDPNLAKPHLTAHQGWSPGNGFEVIDASKSELPIASAEIVGNSVKLTLVQQPADNAGLTVGYAITPDASGDLGGSDLGMHGLLRDSDPFNGHAVETIQLRATNGSDTFMATASALARRAPLDIVSGIGLPADTVVKTPRITGDSITLSAPWTAATGTAPLTFHHNHYNYCVHFALDVP